MSTHGLRVLHAWPVENRRQGGMGRECHNRAVIFVDCLDGRYSLATRSQRNVLCMYVLCMYVLQISPTLVI